MHSGEQAVGSPSTCPSGLTRLAVRKTLLVLHRASGRPHQLVNKDLQIRLFARPAFERHETFSNEVPIPEY